MSENRTVGWFSCGAASAVAMLLEKPDVIAYCETNSEHEDNKRFMADLLPHLNTDITFLQSEKYHDTWDVWTARRYLSGIEGAPCTGELKVKPRLKFQQPGDIHIFGYTADSDDIRRAESLRENWPDLKIKTPLIEMGINKAACLAIIDGLGVANPITYEQGLPNANCIPCVKATSPNYWALIRKLYPAEFWRMARLSRELNVRLTRISDVRIFIDEIPDDWPTTEAIAPACDFLCSIAEQEIHGIKVVSA